MDITTTTAGRLPDGPVCDICGAPLVRLISVETLADPVYVHESTGAAYTPAVHLAERAA
jgi:hypothetical protein